jgi:hypothetical protein
MLSIFWVSNKKMKRKSRHILDALDPPLLLHWRIEWSITMLFFCIFSWTLWEEKTNENKRSTWMLVFLCNLDSSERKKLEMERYVSDAFHFLFSKPFLLIPIQEEQKRPKNIYLVFWDLCQVFICIYLYLLIVSKDGEIYIKKKEKNNFLCI